VSEFNRWAKKDMARTSLDYDQERVSISRKFAVLRRAAATRQSQLDWIARKEAIALQCVARKLPKSAFRSLHSEIRVWVREGLFEPAPKIEMLSELEAIDAARE
jgi:hypothetical protein